MIIRNFASCHISFAHGLEVERQKAEASGF